MAGRVVQEAEEGRGEDVEDDGELGVEVPKQGEVASEKAHLLRLGDGLRRGTPPARKRKNEEAKSEELPEQNPIVPPPSAASSEEEEEIGTKVRCCFLSFFLRCVFQ